MGCRTSLHSRTFFFSQVYRMPRFLLFFVIMAVAAAALLCALLEPQTAEARETPRDRAAVPAGSRAETDAVASARDAGSGDRTSVPSTAPAESKPAPAPVVDVSKSLLVFRGIVYDPDKRPVARASVTASRDSNGYYRALSGDTVTDSDGTFLLGLPERDGWNWKITVRAPGFAPSILTGFPNWHAEVDVGLIVLYPPVTVHGRVATRDGAPVVNAKIFVNSTLSNDVPMEEADSIAESDQPVATTGPDGTYSISQLPPGKMNIGCQAAGYADSVRAGVVLGPTRPNTVDFSLETEDPLRGQVVDENGAAVAKARVFVQAGNQRRSFWRRPVDTDTEGKFLWNGLDRSRRDMTLRILKMGYSSLWQDGNHLPPDEKYTIRKCAIVTLKAERPMGGDQPVIRSVRLERRRGNNRWGGWDEVPKNLREVVAPNVWKFTTEMTGQLRAVVIGEDGLTGTSNDFELAQNAREIELVATFDKPGSLSGRVVKSDMTPLAGVRLEAVTEKQNQYSLKVATTDEKGSFVFDTVAAGPVSVRVGSRDWIATAAKTEVRPGERTEGVEVVANKPSRVSGKLTIGGAPPGEPVSIAFYRIDYYDGRPNWSWINNSTAAADGKFTLSPVPAGRIALVPNRKVEALDGSNRNVENERSHPEWNGEETLNWPWVLEVPPEAEGVLDIDMPAPKPTSIKGVVTINGEPRSGMELSSYLMSGGEWQSDSTDPEGKFTIRVSKAGEYQIQLYSDGFNEMKRVSIAEGEEREVRFDLVSGGVEGSLADPSGQAVSARVRLEKQRDRRSSNEYEGWYNTPEQLAKADGSYNFPEVPAGTYRVVVTDPRRRLATVASSSFTLGPKERYQVPQIRIPMEAPLIVSVRTPDNKPVQGYVRVTAAPNAEPLGQKSVQVWLQRGAIKFRALRPGPVVVGFSPQGTKSYVCQPQTVTLTSDGSPATVVIELKKKDAGGTPAEGTAPADGNTQELANIGYVGGGQIINDSGMMIADFGGFDWGGGWYGDYEYINDPALGTDAGGSKGIWK
jgi:protocatechuate 3,4-dioxygenase beta subunit